MKDWKPSSTRVDSRGASPASIPGKRTLTEALSSSVQRKASTMQVDASRGSDPGRQAPTDAPSTPAQREGAAEAPREGVLGLAQSGIAGGDGALPHFETIQALFGRHDISGTTAHVDGAAAEACGLMGAEAYATGNSVAFRGRPSLHTAAHEAAHVVQQRAGVQLARGVGDTGDAYERHADAVADAVVVGRSAEALLDAAPGGGSEGPAVQRRAATWLERRAWLAFFDHYLPRMFLDNYMDDTGAPITLTQRQMQDCNPIVDIRRSTVFMAQIARLQAAGGGTETVRCTGWGGALTNGTLGNFTIHWNGTVHVLGDGSWSFSGTVDFYDFWDFDPKGSGSGRPWPAELKVRVADAFLPGKPFHIDSVQVSASQTSSDTAASWPSSVTPVGDRAGRTGADIAAGDVAGGEVGGEAGAQSAEDLNR